jgi:hypothetical protein
MVYKEIAFNQQGDNQVIVSVDEKPGIQTAHNIAPDLSPQAKKHPQRHCRNQRGASRSPVGKV